MSYFILNQLRCCRSRVNLNRRCGLNSQQARAYSDDANGDGDDVNTAKGQKSRRHGQLGQAVILVQQGVEVQELPIIVRRYGQNEIVSFCTNKIPLEHLQNKNASDSQSGTAGVSSAQPINSTNVVINPVTDCDTIIKLLEKCETGESILQIIASLPENELEQDMLVFALEKILRIEPMQKLKMFEVSNDTYRYLMDNVCKVCETTVLLNILKQLQSLLFMNQSIDQICDEVLLRNSDGCLSVMEICEAIHRFVECHHFAAAEKFWSGLSDMDQQINENNIKFVFEILPKLKVSRRMVVGILDRRIVEVFPLLKPDAVNDIMEAIKECRIGGHTNCTLKAITRWLNVNIHAVNETHLEQIIHCLSALNYHDADLESALERYMKAKAIKIKSQTLIVEILKHVNEFRLLNPHILNGCSEFFIKEANNLDAGYIRDIVCPFGKLRFQPFNTSKFWETIEIYLDANFNKIPAAHIIEIMLATVYLQLFPVNFIDRVFNRNFMHQLHSTTAMNALPSVREKLKLLDTALTFECNAYKGPLLPRQMGRNPLIIDNRIKRIINDNNDIITLVAGGKDSYSTLTVPQQLPYCALYAIDILFHPAGLSLLSYNKMKDRNILVAALIHLPEHYDSSGTYLIGEQQMRIRHLRHIGMKVVSLQHAKLSKLSMHRKQLHTYIVEQMKQALPGIEPSNDTNC